MSRESLKDWLDSKEFYELMQAYRLAPLYDQGLVVSAYEQVKAAILEAVKSRN